MASNSPFTTRMEIRCIAVWLCIVWAFFVSVDTLTYSVMKTRSLIIVFVLLAVTIGVTMITAPQPQIGARQPSTGHSTEVTILKARATVSFGTNNSNK